MKVVQINSSCEFGSTGRIVVEISKKLDDIGVENYIFYSGNKVSRAKNGRLINSKFDIRVHQVLSRLSGDQGWHSYFSTMRLIRNLKKISPDIIHLHNIHGYYLHMRLLFSYLAKSKTKIVWTLHDCWAFTGHCSHFTEVGCQKWTTQCHSCPQKAEYPYSLIFDRSKTLFNRKQKLYNSVPNMTITTVSHWLAKTAEESKLLSGFHICVIPNGVNTDIFRPLPSLKRIKGIDVSNKKIILGVANVWSGRKGLHDFRQLSNLISKDYIIVLVGIKNEQQIDMPSNILCLDHTDSVSKLVELYSTALVYFNSSTEETFGLTTIEAMSCGTPAITYNSTACSEAITNETGIILQPHDVLGVWNAICKINEKGKACFSRACRNHVMQNYNAESIYEQYIRLYFDKMEDNRCLMD